MVRNPCKSRAREVSRSFHMVAGAGIDEDSDITFHNIDAYRIKPEPNREKREQLIRMGERNTIFHYGLKVSHHNTVESITIKYRCFGIPLKFSQITTPSTY